MSICAELGEQRLRYTEQDVIVSWPDYLFFVEVKYRSPNTCQPDYPNFDRYTTKGAGPDAFAVSADRAAKAGWYELTRNWRIGTRLAFERRQRFALLNLGPQTLADKTPHFVETTRQGPAQRFEFVTRGALLTEARCYASVSPDVEAFIASRELEGRWS